MKVLTLKDSENNVFTPKVSADSIYLSGSTETLTTKFNEMQNTYAQEDHSHEVSDITSLQEFVDERIGVATGANLRYINESLDEINGEEI